MQNLFEAHIASRLNEFGIFSRRHGFHGSIADAFLRINLVLGLILLALTCQAFAVSSISSCGAVMSANNEYWLNQSLSFNGPGACLNISAANVIFDCRGYQINGNSAIGSYGVFANASAIVKNCRINNFETGISLNGNGSAINNTIFATGLLSTGISTIIAPSGLTAYWGFNRQISSTAAGAVPDDSGNNNNLTLKKLSGFGNAVPTWVAGAKSGGGYNIQTAKRGYLEAPDAAGLDFGANDFTVLGWVRADSNVSQMGSEGSFVGKYTRDALPGSNEWAIELQTTPNNSVPCFRIASGIDTYTAASNSEIVPGAWYHLAGRRTGDTIYFYVNGALQNSAFAGNAVVNHAGVGVTIGKHSSSSIVNPSNITVDEIEIYNRSLDDWEIAQIYAQQYPLYANLSGNNIRTIGNSIYFENVLRGSVLDNTLDSKSRSMFFGFSNNNTVVGNTIYSDTWVYNLGAGTSFNNSTAGNKYFTANGIASWNLFDIWANAQDNNWATNGAAIPFGSAKAGSYWYGQGTDGRPYTQKVVGVNRCGDLTVPNYNYTLNSQVSSNGSTCFNVLANGITLNCANNIINGSGSAGSAGIYSGSDGTTIRDCDIRGFNTGVKLTANLANVYRNSFTASVWVNNTGTGSEFNTSSQGNAYYYANGSPSWNNFDIIDTNGDNFADKGQSLPFSHALLGGQWLGNGQDWHPYTFKQLGVGKGTVNLEINAICKFSTNQSYFSVYPNSSNSTYNFSFTLTNDGNVPVTVSSNSYSNSNGANPQFIIYSANYYANSCANPQDFWSMVPNATNDGAQVCDILNFLNTVDTLLINSSYIVDPAAFSQPGRQDSLVFTINYTGTTSCTQSQSVTLLFVPPVGSSNFTVIIDGNVTTIMGVAGQPVNLTVVNATSGITVKLTEHNGWLPLALPQYQDTVVSNDAIGLVTPLVNGAIQPVTMIATGGSVLLDPQVGNYSTKAEVLDSNGAVLGTVYLNVTVRNLADPAASATHNVSLPNDLNIESGILHIYRIYDAYRTYSGGPTYNITIYSNNSATGIPASLVSAMPVSLNITLIDVSQNPGGAPMPNATVVVTEKNGYVTWALNQFMTSNMTNYGIGYAQGSPGGKARFVIIPTGGVVGQEDQIGNYSFVISVQNQSGSTVFSRAVAVTNRDYSTPPSYNGGPLPNQNNVESAILYVYRSYDRVKSWLRYGQ